MKKIALTTLVAAALAAPVGALAQSSLTITGFFKVSYENIKLGNFSGTGHDSEDRVVDDLSRIYFRVVEDLGSGLQAIGQVEWRLNFPAGSDATNGANWVGLKSKRLGALTLGRNDLYYNHTASTLISKASLRAWNASVVSAAGSGGTIVAFGTRTPNVIHYDSPSWNGFNFEVAYSSNPYGAENDIGSSQSKGSGWSLRPYYRSANLEVGYNYWRAKADATTTASTVGICTGVGTPDPSCAAANTIYLSAPATVQPGQRADRVYGSYRWKGFSIGLLFDRSKLRNYVTGATTSKRNAWSIPLAYQTGRHNFWLEYSQARDDKQTAANDGAKMLAVAYAYDFSRRTSLGLTYAKIRNDTGAFYNLWNSAASQGGSADAAVAPGEDPRIIGITMRHAF